MFLFNAFPYTIIEQKVVAWDLDFHVSFFLIFLDNVFLYTTIEEKSYFMPHYAG